MTKGEYTHHSATLADQYARGLMTLDEYLDRVQSLSLTYATSNNWHWMSYLTGATYGPGGKWHHNRP